MSKPPQGFLTIGELTPEQRHQRNLASYSYEQDLYKHIATLSTGSVVALTMFLEKLVNQPHWHWLVVVALSAFAVCLVGMVTMQMLSVLHVKPSSRRNAEHAPASESADDCWERVRWLPRRDRGANGIRY